jgi:hypothetical protein
MNMIAKSMLCGPRDSAGFGSFIYIGGGKDDNNKEDENKIYTF